MRWQTLFVFPTVLPKPANPLGPLITALKRSQIVLNILISECQSSKEDNKDKKEDEVSKKPRTKVSLSFPSSFDFPTLQVEKK